MVALTLLARHATTLRLKQFYMKKTVLTLLATVSALMATAQDAQYVMKVALTDGSSKQFVVSNVSEITFVTQEENDDDDAQTSSDMSATAIDIAKAMAPGWNLGNTLEATNEYASSVYDYEKAWQTTQTTQEIINYVKSLGFNSIRIPCSWYIHFDSGTTTINADWMARVTEIVDYCINAGLYVMLNDHWDNGWLEDSFSDVSTSTVSANCTTLKSIWTQIANNFIDYDSHLIFGGLNEPNKDQSATFSTDQMTALQSYEQAFIDAVRATGGNNAERVLVIQGPKTSLDETVSLLPSYMPTDDVDNKLMVEVHYYEPYQLCQMTADESWGNVFLYWGEDNYVSGSKRNCGDYANESYQANQFANLKSTFYDNGIPVIIGEFGANWKDVSSWTDDVSVSQDSHDASIKTWYKAVVSNSISNGCVPIVWDINYTTKPTMTIIDRENLAIFGTPAYNGIKEAAEETSWPE